MDRSDAQGGGGGGGSGPRRLMGGVMKVAGGNEAFGKSRSLIFRYFVHRKVTSSGPQLHGKQCIIFTRPILGQYPRKGQKG